MKGFIYCLTFPDGRKYVGQTTSLVEQRWARGKRYIGEMRREIEKCGWGTIRAEVLAEIERPDKQSLRDELYRQEYAWGIWLMSYVPFGWNHTLGGNGYNWTSSEKRCKASEISKQRMANPENRRKIGEWAKRFWAEHPEKRLENNRKIGDANRGKKNGMFGKTPWNKGQKLPFIIKPKYEPHWGVSKIGFERVEQKDGLLVG